MLLYVVVSSILDLTKNYAFKENYSVQMIATNCIGGCFKVRNINIVVKTNSNKIQANKFICFKYN
jgi:hypothetical protein